MKMDTSCTNIRDELFGVVCRLQQWMNQCSSTLYFGLGDNVALIFSGRTVKYFSHMCKNFGLGVDGWEVSLKGMMHILVLLGIILCGIY